MRTTFWPGRFEKIEDIYIDGAHNIDGVKALIQTIESMQMKKVGFERDFISKDYLNKILSGESTWNANPKLQDKAKKQAEELKNKCKS